MIEQNESDIHATLFGGGGSESETELSMRLPPVCLCKYFGCGRLWLYLF